MLHVRSNDFSEKQLAEIALAIHHRWEVPTFVKMHEIVVVDEDIEDKARHELARHFEQGFETILENLELAQAFKIARVSKNKFSLEKLEGANLPKWVDEIEGSSRVPEGVYECPHCVLPSTLILGDNKPIIDYKIGDNTIGRTGLSSVLQTFVRPYKGDIITIEANGMLPIATTPEHPLLASSSLTIHRRNGEKHLTEMLFSDGTWLAAEDLVAKNAKNDGNYVVIPIIKGNLCEDQIPLTPFAVKRKPLHGGYREHLPLNEDTAWLLGLYVAAGSVTEAVSFSLGVDQVEIARRIVTTAERLGFSSYSKCIENVNSMNVDIPSRLLARAFDYWCGHKAPNKKIPDFVLFHKEDALIRAFLEGYEIGGNSAKDQLRGNKRNKVSSTTSKILAQQLQLAYARLRIWADIYLKHSKTKGVMMGRRVSLHPEYIVSYPIEPNLKKQKVRFLEDRILSPIRTITRKNYDGKVCNLETSDNSYLVSNAIVHNCGKWFHTDLELSLHTKLHYLI